MDFDFDWLFQLGDPAEAASVSFNDSAWRKLNVPHDWSIEGEFDVKNNHNGYIDAEGHPVPPATAFLPRGTGWYRKHFAFDPQEDKHYYLEFEGVFRNSTLWINGEKAGTHKDGYTGFYYDVTGFLKKGENILALRVDAEINQGWWYEGGGIYRHVILHEKPAVHFIPWGVKVFTPQVSAEKASLKFVLKIVSGKECTVPVHVQLLAPDGHLCAEYQANTQVRSGIQTVSGVFEITNPELWSPESPALYTLKASAGEDVQTVNTGFRFYEFTADKGFFFNGKPYRLGGGCLHHDYGGLGVALPDRAHEKNVEVMKSIGANIIRSAHNAAAPAFLNACDRLGMIVWAETRNVYEPQDLADQIDRDGNHPSIILWGLANTAAPNVIPYVQALNDTAHKLDPYRPTAIALEGNGDTSVRGLPDIPDVTGMNGCGLGGCDDRDHALFPDRKIFISEFGSERGTRGVYDMEPTGADEVEWLGDGRMMAHNGAYMDVFVQCTKYERGNSYQDDGWEHVAHRPWLNGGCLWSAIDYHGEGNGWPIVTSQFGIFDTARFEKDGVWYFRKRWTKQRFIHMIPSHWTWPNGEGKLISCWSMSNEVDYVELFLNGKKIPGTPSYLQKDSPREQYNWSIPYEPGTLLCIGYVNGKEVCRQEYHTCAGAARLNMSADRTVISSDGKDVSFITITVEDNNGVEDPDANELVKVEVSGCGKLIGLCSGDPKSHESQKSDAMKTFHGKLLAIVQSRKDQPGEITVRAVSGSLKTAEIVLTGK